MQRLRFGESIKHAEPILSKEGISTSTTIPKRLNESFEYTLRNIATNFFLRKIQPERPLKTICLAMHGSFNFSIPPHIKNVVIDKVLIRLFETAIDELKLSKRQLHHMIINNRKVNKNTENEDLIISRLKTSSDKLIFNSFFPQTAHSCERLFFGELHLQVKDDIISETPKKVIDKIFCYVENPKYGFSNLEKINIKLTIINKLIYGEANLKATFNTTNSDFIRTFRESSNTKGRVSLSENTRNIRHLLSDELFNDRRKMTFGAALYEINRHSGNLYNSLMLHLESMHVITPQESHILFLTGPSGTTDITLQVLQAIGCNLKDKIIFSLAMIPWMAPSTLHPINDHSFFEIILSSYLQLKSESLPEIEKRITLILKTTTKESTEKEFFTLVHDISNYLINELNNNQVLENINTGIHKKFI